MNKHILYSILPIFLFSIFGFLGPSVLALDYGYKIQVDPLVEHIVAKPSFKTIDTSFSIENQGDPVYISLFPTSSTGATVQTKTRTTKQSNILDKTTFLLTTNEKATVDVQISNQHSALPVKDYVFNIPIQWARPEFVSDKTLSISLKPSLHKRITVSVSDDGNLSVDPKIAFFRNSSGPLILDSANAHIILTVQNRGVHMLPLKGMLFVTNPAGQVSSYPIPNSHIAAGSQAYLVTDPAKNPEGVLLSIPSNKLSGGKYTLRAELSYAQAIEPDQYASSTFWVIPQIFLVALGLSVAILLSIVIFVFIHHT